MTGRAAAPACADEVRNPFASRCTRPAVVAFRFPDGASLATVADALQHANWEGQIVGPHGSGKSTLRYALARELERRGVETLVVELHDGQRHLPPDVWQAIEATTAGRQRLLIVDGFEQLSGWQRWRLRRVCRSAECGLLVTAHADCGLRTLLRTATDATLALELARQLDSSVDAADVERLFQVHRGNLRELWFALYDLCEQRRS